MVQIMQDVYLILSLRLTMAIRPAATQSIASPPVPVRTAVNLRAYPDTRFPARLAYLIHPNGQCLAIGASCPSR